MTEMLKTTEEGDAEYVDPLCLDGDDAHDDAESSGPLKLNDFVDGVTSTKRKRTKDKSWCWK